MGHHHVLSSPCRGMSPPMFRYPLETGPTNAPRDSSRCHGGLNILSQTRPSPPIRWCPRPATWLRRSLGVLDNNSWIKYESQLGQLGLLFPIYGKIKKCSKPPTRSLFSLSNFEPLEKQQAKNHTKIAKSNSLL